MAQTRILTRRQAANYLKTLLATVSDLSMIAERWPKMSSIEQNTFASEWDELMDEFDLLAEYDRDGLLGHQEQELLQMVVAAFKGSEQIILTLDLDIPTNIHNMR